MQINNFYADPVPSVRNPLDSIVLSPHTIKPNEFGLANMAEGSSDYQSLLPSVCSCEFHDQNTCKLTDSLPRLIWDRCRHTLKRYRYRNT